MGFFGNWFGGQKQPQPQQGQGEPQPNRILLQRLRDTVGGWLGPRLSKGTPVEREVTREKIYSGPSGITFPWFLPYADADYTHETNEMRLAYRQMLACPPVKSAFTAKVYSVAAQDLNIRPARKNNRRDSEIADFVRWNLTERLRGCVPELVWTILSGGLVDGYSVCERGWELEERGEWANRIVLATHKAKDVNNDLVVQTDAFRNVTGILGLRYNGGQVFDPVHFTIWRNFSLFDSPTGLSDFRAAFAAFWMRNTVYQLRSLGAALKAFPMLIGEYGSDPQRESLKTSLAQARGQTWMVVPKDVQVRALEVAGASEEYFRQFTEQLDHDIVLSIEGAYLQALQGSENSPRGNSRVHSARADIFKWWLATAMSNVLNDRTGGLIRDMVDLNYMTDRYPTASLSAIDNDQLLQDLQIDLGLQKMGVPLSLEETYDKYGRKPPTSPEDKLVPPAPQQQDKGEGNPDQQGNPAALSDRIGALLGNGNGNGNGSN